MKIGAVLLLAAWLAVFFPRKNLEDGKTPADPKEKLAYALLSALGVTLCILQKWDKFPMIANWMDSGMMLIYRLTGGGPS
ncbi:MAG: hypothetical protein K0Q90_1279 [Paenibacillaceae bacterium]|jgi:hypothetical protein|nr:hypothetical protein [Paenibacillaceae bacterium]